MKLLFGIVAFVLSTGIFAQGHRTNRWAVRVAGALAVILSATGIYSVITGSEWLVTELATYMTSSKKPLVPKPHVIHPPLPAQVKPKPYVAHVSRRNPSAHVCRSPSEQLGAANYDLQTIGKHIYFEIDSAVIDAPGIRTAKAWAHLLKKYPALHGNLVAYDHQNVPAKTVDGKISVPQLTLEGGGGLVTVGARRVMAIRQMLIGYDVPLDRLEVNVTVIGNLDISGPSPPEIVAVDQSVTLVLSEQDGIQSHCTSR